MHVIATSSIIILRRTEGKPFNSVNELAPQQPEISSQLSLTTRLNASLEHIKLFVTWAAKISKGKDLGQPCLTVSPSNI